MSVKEEIFLMDERLRDGYYTNKTFKDAIDALDEVGVSDRMSLFNVIMTLSTQLERKNQKNKELVNTLKRAKNFIEITR